MKNEKEITQMVLNSIVPPQGEAKLVKPSHIAVAVTEVLNAALKANGFSIYYEAGFFITDGTARMKIFTGEVRKLLSDIAMKIGVDYADAKYFRTIDAMERQLIHG